MAAPVRTLKKIKCPVCGKVVQARPRGDVFKPMPHTEEHNGIRIRCPGSDRTAEPETD